MDTIVVPKEKVNATVLGSYFLKIQNSELLPLAHGRVPVVKYTKIPEVDYIKKVSWPRGSYVLHPRLRRIIEVPDADRISSRSLNLVPFTDMLSARTQRKIVTIREDEENKFNPKLSTDLKKPNKSPNNAKTVRTVEVNNNKQLSTRRTSRATETLESFKGNRSTKKQYLKKDLSDKKGTNLSYVNNRNNKLAFDSKQDKPRTIMIRDKESKWRNESPIFIPKKKNTPTSEIKSPKKCDDTYRSKYSSPRRNRSKLSIWEQTKNKSVAHEIIDTDCQKAEKVTSEINPIMISLKPDSNQVDCCIETEHKITSVDAKIGEDSIKKFVDRDTQVETDFLIESKVNSNVQTEVYDNLDIPNVTLTKDLTRDETKISSSKSLPNLEVPTHKVTSCTYENQNSDSKFYNSTSVIISRATVTYTTKKEINFCMLSSEDTTASHSPSPLSYPMNVISVCKKNIRNRAIDNAIENNNKYIHESNSRIRSNRLDDIRSLTFSSDLFDAMKLVKPSDIISSIKINYGLIQNDYIYEQFQRELSFIDSYFESLQYLENCTLSDKSNKCQDSLDNKTYKINTDLKYVADLIKSDNCPQLNDNGVIASKSLCLLNLLIRDEQRRANDLLFVLKMREDALRDFTKSQILWLENKKKQQNTDVSTLKKKQRGALLKLQLECGEMQRMRKALLSLSEKRKAALMKTKKNIEQKTRQSIDLDQILLGKKKLKRSLTPDRNLTPLKCFELSSSGCDENTLLRIKSEKSLEIVPKIDVTNKNKVTIAEKCVQTCDSILQTVIVENDNHIVAENYIVVDGGYLNIVFHNLSLPQIFNRGKNYEVNEGALKNIVNAANSNLYWTKTDVVQNWIDDMKNHDNRSSSTPSTARSLVDELDQYYRGFVEDDPPIIDITNNNIAPQDVSPTSDKSLRNEPCELQPQIVWENVCQINNLTGVSNNEDTVINSSNNEDTVINATNKVSIVVEDSVALKDAENSINNNVSEIALENESCKELLVNNKPESDPTEVCNKIPSNVSSTPESSLSSEHLCPSLSSLTSITSPVHYEAEELRRQQLAIEREIQVLEEQQNQLFAVREIPDKPPPPYTPPTKYRVKPPSMFAVDETTDWKIHKHITEPNSIPIDSTNAFDVFVNDLCAEVLEKQSMNASVKPWDACNLFPQKSELEPEELAQKTSRDLLDILTGVAPTVVTGVSTRRSDHIDDILFKEWRSKEPEWTALYSDEVLVKNQVFQSIFQRVLTETVDEYKKTVVGVKIDE